MISSFDSAGTAKKSNRKPLFVYLEYKCSKCRKEFSFEHFEGVRFCDKCGTRLGDHCQLKYWMFQFNPSIYAWLGRKREETETEQWLTSKYARRIHEGDRVAIWASGEKAGIYALAEIATNPAVKALDFQQEKDWKSKDNVLKFRKKRSVIIKYSRVAFEKPLLEQECRRDPVLSGMAVLKQHQGTNFRLTPMQWLRILKLIDSKTRKTQKLDES